MEATNIFPQYVRPVNHLTVMQSETPATGRRVWLRIWALLKPIAIDRLNIVDLAEPESTIAGIKKDIEFKGFNLWILVFSIFIASIGLNVDSTAVVIGAMLISPLMGPIMGFGLGIGINDLSVVRKSLLNLGVAASIAILTSALYFLVSPIDEASNELFARTNPTFLDVLVAIFGGLTGILAGSRKEKNNVIPGVAIATALMPPLCTAGFGLASGQWEYFFGAFYLFLINAILIATSTTLVVRYLRFPLVAVLDPAKERKYKRMFTIGLMALVLPSGWIFYKTVSQTVTSSQIRSYLTEHAQFPGTEIVKSEITWPDGTPVVNLVLLGEHVPEALTEQWGTGLATEVPGAQLHVVQNAAGPDNLEEMQRLIDLYAEGRETLATRDEEIRELRATLESTREQLGAMTLPPSLAEEVRLQHAAIAGASVGMFMRSGTTDWRPRVEIQWVDSAEVPWTPADQLRVTDWLRLRLAAPTLEVANF